MWVDKVHRSILKVKLYWVGLPSREGGGQGHELRLTTWRCPGSSCCMPRSSPWSWKLTFSAKIAIVPNISHSSSALTLQTPQLMWVVRWEFKKYFSIWLKFKKYFSIWIKFKKYFSIWPPPAPQSIPYPGLDHRGSGPLLVRNPHYNKLYTGNTRWWWWWCQYAMTFIS